MEQSMPVGLRFSLLHRAFRRRMDELLSEKDLTGVQFGVLGALVRLEKDGQTEISQSALEERTRVSHATMTELLKRLEKKDFLRCEQSPRDRRCKIIRPNQRAYALINELAELENETFSWLCTGLAPEQVEALLQTTDLMLRNAFESFHKKGCDCGCD